MTRNGALAVAGLVFALASLSPAMAADAAKATAPGLSRADSILKQMSDVLANARRFSFRGTREVAVALAQAKGMQARSEIEVIVERPNKVAGSSTNADGVRRLVFDGETFTLFDGTKNMWATVLMAASLDALPARLAKTYGFVPPLADFIISNPYEDIKRRTSAIAYAGNGRCGTPAIECDRLVLSGKLADAELWIGVKDHLPRRMTAKVKGGTDAGTDLTIEFTHWDLNPQVTDRTFAFVPPKDSQRVPMITTAAAQAVKK